MEQPYMKFEEKANLQLRSIYRRYGYLPYHMSKFEEYELYSKNKDFLVSDRVITFNDTNGKLMALKPDVTLSIIKSGEDCPGVKQKVFYSENVYRVGESSHRFKEIMQTGLECIGDVDLYDIFEVISLSAESLSSFSDDFCLEISNQTFVSDVISSACEDPGFLYEVIPCIAAKNPHELKTVCDRYAVGKADYETLSLLISVYGERKAVLSALQNRIRSSALSDLIALDALLSSSAHSDRIRFDFSVVNDMNYYNGFVFKGFIPGICFGVLAGGQYDNLMRKMGRKAKAIGFALYLDRLSELKQERAQYDVDVLLLYDEKSDPCAVSEAVAKLVGKGETVSAQKSIPQKLRFAKTVDLRTKP